MQGENMLAVRLERTRRQRGMPAMILAELCGLSKDMVRKYERGERRPSVRALEAMATTLEVSTDYLLGRKEGA